MKQLDNLSMVEYYLSLTNDADEIQSLEQVREKDMIEFHTEDPDTILSLNLNLLSTIYQNNPEFIKKIAIKILYLDNYVLRITNMEK